MENKSTKIHPESVKPEKLTRRERNLRLKTRRSPRQQLTRVIDHGVVQWGILILVLFDAVLFAVEYEESVVIAFGGGDKDKGSLNINTVSLAIVCIFAVEVTLKIIAYGKRFFKDALNVADFLIVILSFGASLTTYLIESDAAIVANLNDAGNAVVFLRLFRLLRVLRFLSKIHQHARSSKNKGATFDVPAERVVHLLRKLKDREEAICGVLEKEGRNANGFGDLDRIQELKFIIRIILTRQLYKPSLEQIEGMEADDNSEIQRFILNEYAGANDTNAAQMARKRAASNVDKMLLPNDASQRVEKRRASVMLLGLTETGPISEEKALQQDDTNEKENVEENTIVEKLKELDFNAFKLSETTPQPVFFVMTAAVLKLGLHKRLTINVDKMRSYLKEIETMWNDRNPYHNSVKAADAIQFIYFLLSSGFDEKMSDISQLAVLCGGFIVFVRHSGLTNRFHIENDTKESILYNDRAVNQNNALTAAFEVLWKKDNNFIESLDSASAKQFRDFVIAGVLSTDFVQHGETLGQFKGKVEAAQLGDDAAVAFDQSNVEDMKVLVRIVLHAAQVSTCTRSEGICLQWARLRMEERFKQGDREKEAPRRMDGEPTPFCDRQLQFALEKLHVAEIEYVSMPIFKALSAYLPSLSTCIPALEKNDGMFKKLIEGDEATLAFATTVFAAQMTSGDMTHTSIEKLALK